MEKSSTQQQPQIVKYVEASHSGIESVTLSRNAIGYLLRGTKYVYYGDRRYRISRGDIFYMGVGHHYVEHFPEEGYPFEQIVFYYTPSCLQHILSHLNISYGVHFSNSHSCDWCRFHNHVAMPAWNAAKSFFGNTNSYLREEVFQHDETAENIKMTELIYLIMSHDDCCMKSKLMSNIDIARGNFEQVVYDHMFKDVSIEQLSGMCNRSLTSFKKEFKRRFSMPPHKWFIRHRLMHSRLLLISTSMSVSEIGNECAFPNTSHFIKLFKKEFLITPSAYRSKYMAENGSKNLSCTDVREVDELKVMGV